MTSAPWWESAPLAAPTPAPTPAPDAAWWESAPLAQTPAPADGPVDVSRLPELDPTRSHGGSVVSGIINAIRGIGETTGGVMRGEVNPTSPQAIESMADAAMQFGPVAPARLGTQAARSWLGDARASANRPPPSPVAPRDTLGQMADSAAASQRASSAPLVEAIHRQGLGDVTPAFIASESRPLQMSAQALKQAPIGGSVVEGASNDFLAGLAGRAEGLATDITGTGTKATAPALGGDIRQTLASAAARQEEAARVANALREQAATTEALRAGQTAQQAVADVRGLAPEPLSRAAVGGDVVSALERRLEAHSEAMGEPYRTLRETHIDPTKGVPEARKPLQDTMARIMADRVNAAEPGLPAPLKPVAELMQRPGGPNFDALQRARSRLGEIISDFDPHQGFAKGDLKAAYGALTEAMQAAAQGAARENRTAALRALTEANQNFAQRLDTMGEIKSALRSGPEALAERIVGYAGDRSGANIDKLRTLTAELPDTVRAQIADMALQRLARGPTGDFSEAALARGWANLTPEGRDVLFGPRSAQIDAAVQRVRGTSAAADVTRGLLEDATQRQSKTTLAEAKAANADVTGLLSHSNEGIVDTLLHYARAGAGADTNRLVQMTRQMGPDQVKGLASIAIDRLGRSPTDGKFSPAYFRKNWTKLSEGGKSQLFPDPVVRQALNDLHRISERAAEVERKYANSSNTARAGLLGAMGAHFMADPMSALATAVGSYAFARIISKPIGAKAAASWAKSYEAAARRPSPGLTRSLEKAGQRLAAAAKEHAGVVFNPGALVTLGLAAADRNRPAPRPPQ